MSRNRVEKKQVKTVALTEEGYRRLRAVAGEQCLTTGRAVDFLLDMYERMKSSETERSEEK